MAKKKIAPNVVIHIISALLLLFVGFSDAIDDTLQPAVRGNRTAASIAPPVPRRRPAPGASATARTAPRRRPAPGSATARPVPGRRPAPVNGSDLSQPPSGRKEGSWQLLLNNTGVVAMHMALTHENTVIMFDQTEAGRSSYPLRKRYNGKRCLGGWDLDDPSCYAHSVEYDISRNKVRALRLDSDPWCSSGAFLSSGTLLQAGGYRGGSRRIRYFRPCPDAECDWKQIKTSLSRNRWYATAQLLPHNDKSHYSWRKRGV